MITPIYQEATFVLFTGEGIDAQYKGLDRLTFTWLDRCIEEGSLESIEIKLHLGRPLSYQQR